MSALAKALESSELESGIDVSSRLSRADTAREWGPSDVQSPPPLRLYRATASEHFVLITGRDRERGTGVDRGEPVTL